MHVLKGLSQQRDTFNFIKNNVPSKWRPRTELVWSLAGKALISEYFLEELNAWQTSWGERGDSKLYPSLSHSSFAVIQSDLRGMRAANPELRLLASLSSDEFSQLISDDLSLANLTESIRDLYKAKVIDGVEIDWEWPTIGGDKKDRVRLVRLARVRIPSDKKFLHTVDACHILSMHVTYCRCMSHTIWCKCTLGWANFLYLVACYTVFVARLV